MVGENNVRAIADEQITVHPHAGGAQSVHFFDEGKRIQYDPVADDTTAAFAQHAARDELEDELLAVDGNRVPGIVAAGITRYKLEPLGQNVNNLAFAFITPLGADDDRCLTDFQLAAPSTIAPRYTRRPHRFAHNSPHFEQAQTKFGEIKVRRAV